MNWIDVDALAEQAVKLGWDGKSRLPRRIRVAIKSAAHAAPLPRPTAQELAAAQSSNRFRIALWVLGGLAVFGQMLYLMFTEGVDEASLVVTGVLSLPLVALLPRAFIGWNADPNDVYITRHRAKMRAEGRQHVRAAAAEIRRSVIPLASTFMTPRDAEHLAARIMTNLGAKNVRVTPATRDGGLDVVADGFVAEVKHHADKVAAAPVHRIFGVAQARGARALFFTMTGYRPEAITFAETAGVALFTYDPATGAVAGHSSAARSALREGL